MAATSPSIAPRAGSGGGAVHDHAEHERAAGAVVPVPVSAAPPMIVPVLACTLSSAAVPRNRACERPAAPGPGSASSRIGHHGAARAACTTDRSSRADRAVAATQARSVVGRPRERHAERRERVAGRGRATLHRSASGRLRADVLHQHVGDLVVTVLEHLVHELGDGGRLDRREQRSFDGRGRVRGRARDRHALRGERSAEAVGVRERGIGEEGRVGAPAIAIDHQCRQRPGVGRDLPVLPTGGAAGAVVARLVDEQRARDLGDTASRTWAASSASECGPADASVGSPPGTITRSPEGASLTSVARRASGPRTASAPIAVSSFWFDAGASATSGSRVSTSPSPSIHTETDAAFGAMRASAAKASSAAARSAGTGAADGCPNDGSGQHDGRADRSSVVVVGAGARWSWSSTVPSTWPRGVRPIRGGR